MTTLTKGDTDAGEEGASPTALLTQGGNLRVTLTSLEGWNRLYAANNDMRGMLAADIAKIRALTDPATPLDHVRHPPDFSAVIGASMVVSMRPERIKMRCGTAIRFLALYDQDERFGADDKFMYVAEALSRDGRLLVVAEIEVGHAPFAVGPVPKLGFDVDTPAGKVAAQKLREAAGKADPGSFAPSLADVDRAVSSYDYGCGAQ